MSLVTNSDLKISTITITAGLNIAIDLDVLYNRIQIAEDEDDGFTYVEYGKKNGLPIFCKGFHKKLTIARRKKKIGKRFDNQITVIIRNNVDNKIESANVKIFKNGNLQMAGVKSNNHGDNLLDFLVSFFKDQSKESDIVEDISNISIINHKIQLINSDFRIGFNIKREKLFKLLQNSYSDTYSTYEPCIYPGVKIQYVSDKQNNKKTTIAVFRSGCVIVTGAQKMEDTLNAYKFIKNLLTDNKKEIEMTVVTDPLPNNNLVKKNKTKSIILPKGYVLE